jgi:hypothetical protein
MKRAIIIILTLVFGGGLSAQTTRILAGMDTVEHQPNAYIEGNKDWREFFQNGVAGEEMDLLELDQELLNAAVFFTINKYRKKIGRAPLRYSKELDVMAHNYINSYSRNSFKPTKKNRDRIIKTIRFSAKKAQFRGGLLQTNVAVPYMIDYRKNRTYHYDKKNEETDLKLFYGSRPTGEDTTAHIVPIPLHSYASFADGLVKSWFSKWGRRNSRSKAFSYGAVHIELDKNSLFKNRIPNAKAIQMMGGKRTGLLD